MSLIFAPIVRRHPLALAAAAALFAGWLLAGDAAAQAAKEAPSAGAAPAAPTLPAYQVEGFRSAHFGMTEADVRKAIAADFKVADKAITKDTNTVEQTTILSVTVHDLLAEAGPAHISYIFGYTRHQLIYVTVQWTAPKKGAANGLLGPGASLRNYFLGYSYRAEGLLRDVPLGDGSLLMFQGSDQKGRTISLVTGEAAVAGDAKAEHQWVLRLSYIENPNQPDIFKIKPGTF